MNTQLNVDKLSKYVNSVRDSYESSLKRLVDIPSVSMDPACRTNIQRAAECACELLTDIGAEAQIVNTTGNPVVLAVLQAQSNDPTVTIYNHLDVQPADHSEWETDPFLMTIENGIYRGRGTTDDKGPALAVLYAAKYAHDHQFPINIKFIWELEEEIGSKSFEHFLKQNKDKLKTDSIVVSDTIWVAKNKPAIPYGLRGLQGMTLKLKTGAKDVHSGTTGGLARNPIGELSQLIYECYDARSGHVKIPGFYDDVKAPSESELENFMQSGFSIKNFMSAHELNSLRTTDPKEAAKRIWAQPTFEVHGITGGYTGPGIKTIVPHEAEAKISMRLVPDQNPDKIADLFIRFVKKMAPDVEIEREGSLRPYLGELSSPYAKAATQAMREAFGKEPAFTREGGSIGAVVSMHEVLKVPITFLGLSLPEHGYHAINENFDWEQAQGGIKMFIKYFDLISRI